MIQYISSIGIGSPLIATEVFHMQRCGIPCALAQLRRHDEKVFDSEWAQNLLAETHTVRF